MSLQCSSDVQHMPSFLKRVTFGTHPHAVSRKPADPRPTSHYSAPSRIRSVLFGAAVQGIACQGYV